MERMEPKISPDEFAARVRALIAGCGSDWELLHLDLDNLMGEVLSDLGYDEGLDVIKTADISLWYA